MQLSLQALKGRSMNNEILKRVKTFLDAYEKRRGLHSEVIHGVDHDKELLVSDLRALLTEIERLHKGETK
jgi:hypothetical protein